MGRESEQRSRGGLHHCPGVLGILVRGGGDAQHYKRAMAALKSVPVNINYSTYSAHVVQGIVRRRGQPRVERIEVDPRFGPPNQQLPYGSGWPHYRQIEEGDE